MGPNQSKTTYSETDVKNIMNTMIKNATSNINNIINTTTTNITTEVINTNISKTEVKANCENTANLENIDISGSKNTAKLQQSCIEDLKMSACQQLANNSSAMANLASQINTNVMNQLQNENAAQNSLNTLAQCQLATQQQGGITGMLSNITAGMANILPSITGANTSSDSKTISKVLTQIGVNVSNITENINNIKNQISNQIMTGIKNSNTTSSNRSFRRRKRC